MRVRNAIQMFLSLVYILLCLVEYGRAMEPFVVGGEYAKIQEFPHSAFLAVSCITTVSGKTWACGSSIINQYILLTAAHCLDGCLPSSYIGVRVGTANKRKGLTHSADKFLAHKSFKSHPIMNDIGLVSLKTPLKFNDKVKRVIIMKHPPKLKTAVVAGWGITDEKTGTSTLFLKTAQQILWESNDCEDMLMRSLPGTICASNGYEGTNKLGHAAEGDSGSALMIKNFIQIGIVSFKKPSVQNDLVVYTNVSYFYDWIMKTGKNLYCRRGK